MSEAQNPQNIWEENLNLELKALKMCQEKNQIDSCFVCAKILECSSRKNYVKAVYESMNKGQGGDFEF
ncbi:hypothetical protein BKH46_02725 [Helicobacter sp. 12S02634-8]|uniref:hypothetical protein n=1 Tax=Helicobacter sp. 12S02634-8 TaxID=1476199 RepID=UPI000BA7A08A|nr:hypothetical protein [Helicobacter sp. 12S02634-8]PAF47770.1 hypothetical protein BKH46_02725 [Helicobacter sp. 12S02634-8]